MSQNSLNYPDNDTSTVNNDNKEKNHQKQHQQVIRARYINHHNNYHHYWRHHFYYDSAAPSPSVTTKTLPQNSYNYIHEGTKHETCQNYIDYIQHYHDYKDYGYPASAINIQSTSLSSSFVKKEEVVALQTFHQDSFTLVLPVVDEYPYEEHHHYAHHHFYHTAYYHPYPQLDQNNNDSNHIQIQCKEQQEH